MLSVRNVVAVSKTEHSALATVNNRGDIFPARDFLSDAAPASHFKGENRGWRKSLETLRNLRQPLNFIEKVDND